VPCVLQGFDHGRQLRQWRKQPVQFDGLDHPCARPIRSADSLPALMARKIVDRLTPVAAAPVTSEYIGHSPCVIGHSEWIALVNALLLGKCPQEARRAAFGASYRGQRLIRNNACGARQGENR
jgi:hypothetical protein